MIDEIRPDDLGNAVVIEVAHGHEGPDQTRVDHRAAIGSQDFDCADDIEFSIAIDVIRHDIRPIRMLERR